jgi:hypothetical protein
LEKGLVVQKKALLLQPLWERSFSRIYDLIIYDLRFISKLKADK